MKYTRPVIMDDCIMNDGVSTIDDSSVAVSWEDSSVERSVARDDAAPSVVEEEEVDEAVLTSIYEFAGLDQSSSPAWLHDFLAARLLAEEGTSHWPRRRSRYVA